MHIIIIGVWNIFKWLVLWVDESFNLSILRIGL